MFVAGPWDASLLALRGLAGPHARLGMPFLWGLLEATRALHTRALGCPPCGACWRPRAPWDAEPVGLFRGLLEPRLGMPLCWLLIVTGGTPCLSALRTSGTTRALACPPCGDSDAEPVGLFRGLRLAAGS